jgi:magnesium transporter
MLKTHPPVCETKDAIWLDLLNASEPEIAEIEAATGIDLPNRDELSQIEQSSRLDFTDGVLRMASPVVAQADTDHPQLSQIGLILTKDRLISIRYDALSVFDALSGKIDVTRGGDSSTGLFATLMESIVARLADLLEGASAHLDQISHRVFRPSRTDPKQAMRSTGVMREKLQVLGRIGERTSMIRETLLAIDRMISFALEAAKDWFEPPLAHRLETARKDVDSLNLFEEHLLGKVQFLLDAVLGFINIEQNDIFKVLTIASVVGIFPTLVAGWYGMNFHNMPEYDWAYGYQFGIGAIIAATILPLIWFKWKGWM